MFTSKDDFVVQMPSIKTELFSFEQPASVSSAHEFSIKSESNISYEYDISKSDDRSKYGSEFITPESTNGKFLKHNVAAGDAKMLPKIGISCHSATSLLFAENLRNKMNVLQAELNELKARRQQQETELANIENSALRQRFQDILDNLLSEQLEKEQQVSIVLFLKQDFRCFCKLIFLFHIAVSRTCLLVGWNSLKLKCFKICCV